MVSNYCTVVLAAAVAFYIRRSKFLTEEDVKRLTVKVVCTIAGGDKKSFGIESRTMIYSRLVSFDCPIGSGG